MTVLTDAELVLGMSRHLAAYQMGPERAALDGLELAGQVYDMAFRLRGSTTSSAARVKAIALEVGLGPRRLRDAMTTMNSLGWLDVVRDAQGEPVTINEVIPAPGTLVTLAGSVLDVILVSATERAALALLRATTLQPLVLEQALEAGTIAGAEEDTTTAALRHLEFTGLVKRVTADDGREVVFNPNVWTQGEAVTKAALRAADARATGEVSALLEEVAASPGLPDSRVTSTERKWIDFAVSQGLVQRSVVQTSEGVEQGFLFTPHLARDPFGGTAGDASGQVRQLVGSMVYATTFARFKLDDPAQFLRALINRGVAGNVSSIGTDYPMLEKAGIVRVIDGYPPGRYRLELLQSEVAEDALRLLHTKAEPGTARADAAALRAQRSYVHLEHERARLALTTVVDEVEEARLISALREETTRRTFGGR